VTVLIDTKSSYSVEISMQGILINCSKWFINLLCY